MSGNNAIRSRRTPPSAARARKAELRQIRRELTPQLLVGSVRGDPPAITNNGRFIDRVVRVANGTPGKLTVGDISVALKNSANNGPSGDFYIRCIKMWGVAGTTPIGCNFEQANLVSNNRLSGTDQIYVQDSGTYASLPGVRASVPLNHAVLQNFDTANTVTLANSITGPDNPIIHVSVRQML